MLRVLARNRSCSSLLSGAQAQLRHKLEHTFDFSCSAASQDSHKRDGGDKEHSQRDDRGSDGGERDSDAMRQFEEHLRRLQGMIWA